MAVLDADLVHRWFDRLRRQDLSAIAFWDVRPTDQERAAIDEGGTAIGCAIRDLPAPAPVLALTETPALMLRDYLTGFAAGITEARRLLRVEPAVDLGGLAGGVDPGASAVGALALAAGLNAAAAALAGWAADRPSAGRGGPTAAESARAAGVTAAEVVVDGADLHRVAAHAAGTAVDGWRVGLPDDPAERADYRAKALVGTVLVALELECREPLPPARPASCGALPGENRGAAFLAEITCTLHVADEALPTLIGELNRLCREVALWPTDRSSSLHLHTDRPGEAIEQLYASGVPFDLAITRLG
ncbi:hypothetical protein [Nakamurella sp.]|uniref:hypothetical protein n=1 Tax=Nakamurella sp. TaxID=1869182 RepID=UPI003783727F